MANEKKTHIVFPSGFVISVKANQKSHYAELNTRLPGLVVEQCVARKISDDNPAPKGAETSSGWYLCPTDERRANTKVTVKGAHWKSGQPLPWAVEFGQTFAALPDAEQLRLVEMADAVRVSQRASGTQTATGNKTAIDF